MEKPKTLKPTKKTVPNNIVGVKLVTGIDFIGIKRTGLKTKELYEKCTQLMVTPNPGSGMEVRFVPLNLFDSAFNKLPYRDLTIAKNFVLYEYLPDNNIVNAYVNMLTVGQEADDKVIRH
jgi:hypothetical protein